MEKKPELTIREYARRSGQRGCEDLDRKPHGHHGKRWRKPCPPPASGPPTTNVTVYGSGFTANMLIDVYFDTTDTAVTSASSNGTFSVALEVPAAAQPGDHTVTAVVRGSGIRAHKRFLVQTNWAEFGFTPKGRRNNPYENTLNPSNVGLIDEHWRFSSGGILNGVNSPALANGIAYVGSAANFFYALNATTGATLWTFTTDPFPSLLGSPAVGEGLVYLGWSDGNIYALNARSGAMQWTFEAGGAYSPLVANGMVYVGSENKNVYALNATTGTKVWSFATGNATSSTPAVASANGVVYVGSDSVFALNASTGAELWTFGSFGPFSSPVVGNGVVYVEDQLYVYALNASTGAKLWNFSPTAQLSSSPALANGVVYFGAYDSNVYALNANTGVKLWNFTTGGIVQSSPAVANGVVYVGSDDDLVYALDAVTGARLWSFATGGSVYSSPVVVNGVVYAGSSDGNLYAFDLAGGTIASRSAPVAPPDPTTLTPDYSLTPFAPAADN